MLLLIEFGAHRCPSFLQKQIKIYCSLFKIEDFWSHVAIVFTKAYYYTPEEKFQEQKENLTKEGGLIPEIIIFVQKHYKGNK